jgi:hypothetical protein
MKKALVLFMLFALIAPMLWGIWRVRRLPRHRMPITPEDEE